MGRLILPDAPWRHRAGLAELAEVLAADGGGARFVGGAVRDTLLGLPVADIDIATPLDPHAVMARLKAAGVKAVPTGIAHGTITAVLPDGPIEVTTLRHDVETDGRHARVAFTDDWQADAARRDFTMNALYADPASGAVFDYFEGLADLKAGRVRFIGDPLQRIAEDHLRILRFFRFHARFGDTPDAAGLDACTARANDLMALSRERIAAELLKLLVARGAVETVALMVERNIFAPVLPEIGTAGVERFRRVADAEGHAELTPNPIRRLAALLPDDPAIGEAVGARLKLSNVDRKRLVSALDDEVGAPHPLAYRLGTEMALDRWLLHVIEPMDRDLGARDISTWPVPHFPLSGGAIVARGVAKGPDVARLRRQIEDQWITEGFPDAARVDALADQAVVSWLRSAR
jgi:poly(A) polymerase